MGQGMNRVAFPSSKNVRGLLKSRLWAQILVALIFGGVCGLIFSPSIGSSLSLSASDSEELAQWLHLPGALFLNMIQMVVIVLVMTSIILGLTSAGDPEILAKFASRITPYFLLTSTIAVLIGAAVAIVIKPGKFIDVSVLDGEGEFKEIQSDVVADTSLTHSISSIIPSNITEAVLTQNMFQLVVVAIMVGTAISSIGVSRSEPVLRLLQSVQSIALKIVSWAMRLAPIAVFGLIFEFVMQVGISALVGMSAYIMSVVIGLFLLVVFYMVVVAVFGKRTPKEFAKAISAVQLLAFSTSSSAATMPLTLKVAEIRLKIRPSIAKFIVPLGATVNMDGTALYQVVAALFVCQAYGVQLDPQAFSILVLSVVGASIGSPSTPGVGIVILATILQSLGIPASGVAILLGVDRILDMCRTSVNVTGDLVACSVMNEWLADDIDAIKTERASSGEDNVEVKI